MANPILNTYNPDDTTNLTVEANPLVFTASGAIASLAALGNPAPATHKGLVVLNGTGVLAMTLAAPIAGVDDGKKIDILDATGHAHTITTPAGGINVTHTVITMTGTLGNMISLRAWNGTWFFIAGSGTVTT